MGQRVSHRALEEFLRRRAQGKIGRQVVVKRVQGLEEALHFLRPGQRCGITPLLLSLGYREGPIEQVAHVGKDPRRRAAPVASPVIGKTLRRTPQRLACPISQRGQGMAQHLTIRILRIHVLSLLGLQDKERYRVRVVWARANYGCDAALANRAEVERRRWDNTSAKDL